MRQYIYHIKVRSPASGKWTDVFGTISARDSSEVERILEKENGKIEVRTIIRVREQKR